MSRFTDRALRVMLATVTLSASACYHPARTYLKETPLVVAPGAPVHVADRVEVALDGMQLHVRKTALCVASSVGEYTIVREDRAFKQGMKRKPALILGAVGAVAATVGYFVIASPTESEARFALGFPLLLLGGSFAVMGPIAAAFPDIRRKTHEPSTHAAVTFPNRNDWKTCGDPQPATGTAKIEVLGGSDTATLEMGVAGTLQLPDDLRAWASTCDVDLQLTVAFDASGNDHTSKSSLLSARTEEANIANYEGDDHEASAIRSRLALDDMHIELGANAGKLEPQPYFETERWSFTIAKPSSSVAPPSSGGTRAAELARACRDRRKQENDRQRAEARARCIAPMKASVEAECRPTCTDTSKQKFCIAEHKDCIAMTAGIKGNLQERCDAARDKCFSDAGQDSSSIERCTQTCATKVYDAKCPL